MTRQETDICPNLPRERFASGQLAPLTGRGWLASVDPETAARILSIGRIRNLREGDSLFNVGDGDGGLFGVIWGGVLVWVPGDEATMLPAHVMRAGSRIGTGPLMTRRRGILTAHAAEDCVCLYLPLSRLNGLISEDPAVAGAIAQLSSFSTDTCIECASDLLIRNSEQRIAAVLLRITTTAAGDVSPSDPRGFVISHSLIAQLCNASRDTLSQALARFRDRGWIDAGYRRLVVGDVEALLC